jgi:hypothetical protein
MNGYLRAWLSCFVSFALLAPCGASLAQPAATWPAVRDELAQYWKQAYPTEKILRAEPRGALQYYSTERRTEVDASWGWIWDVRVIETPGAYARQVALVTVERANRTQARFEVAALYQRTGNAWNFRQIVVGKSEDLSAAKAGDLPSREAAIQIFSDAWKKYRPDFDVQAIEVLSSEPKQYQDRRWINYKLAVAATGTDKGSRAMFGKKYRCTPEDYSSQLKLESGAWVADEKMIRNINEDRDCSPAR